ncbi:MAG TPA: radical SAM protein [Phycisphaerae bacterium]|nr:radical SAM protein [Phycisphaerae bacterium]
MNAKTPADGSSGYPAECPPPRLVFWETTAGCNLECVHCRRLDVSHELMRNDLGTAEGLRLIDQIAAVGQCVLVFSGGEPLMRPDIFDLTGHAKDQNLPAALATNGTMIDEGLAGRIAAAGFDRVSVSLDGADADTHDAFRGQQGSFDRAMQALHLLRKAGVPTQLNCTIARHNRQQLDKVMQLGKQVGVEAIHYFLLVPVGCGEQIAESQMLDATEVEQRLLEIYDIEQRTDMQVKATCAPHYYRILRQENRKRGLSPVSRGGHSAGHPGGHGGGHGASLHSITKGCLAGTAVCFVSHDGKVFPCGYLPAEAGDIRKQTFGEIWQSSAVFADMRDPSKLTGKCGGCPFKAVCGGCRARAFYESGDYLAEEPFCAFEVEKP